MIVFNSALASFLIILACSRETGLGVALTLALVAVAVAFGARVFRRESA